MTEQKPHILDTQIGSLLDTIGNTPLVRAQRLTARTPHISLLLKLENANPGYSIKDRIVKYIIEDAEKQGLLLPGGTIIENTSGNTGAAVAMIAAIKGYKAILTMPDKVSREKQNALKAMGAEIIITPTAVLPTSPEHYVNVAKRLAAETPNSFRIDQYNNLHNPAAHYQSTGPEIWRQTGGRIDYFIASASTGGTISGAGRYLKEQLPALKIIMPDPIGSIYYSYFHQGVIPPNAVCDYQLEGIGEDHLVGALDFSLVDDIVQVSDQDAFITARRLAREEGILAGGSAGANVWAALQLADQLQEPATIVTIIPDSGLKYLSKFLDNTWMEKNYPTHPLE